MDCGAPLLLDENISADTTLATDCYLVTRDIQVSATLVIEPGAVLEFESGTGMKITDGSISAVGSASDPILLTSAEGIIGDWKGLVVESRSLNNELAFVIIEHGGQASLSFNRNNTANLVVLSDARLAATNSTFRDGSEHGVVLLSGAELLAFSENEFVANAGPPMQLNSPQLGDIGPGNAFGIEAAEGREYVALARHSAGSRSSTTERSQSWRAVDLPYRFFGSHFVDNDAVLTIEAGAVLEFGQDSGLKISSGALKAQGASAAPVTFTSATGLAGDWYGLVIESNSPDTSLDHIVAEHGGGTSLSFNSNISASLVLLADARASITNSVFRESSAYGLAMRPGAELVEFLDNEFIANEGAPMQLNSPQIGDIGAGNTFGTDAATGKAHVELASHSSGSNSSTTQRTGTWRALDVPYRFFGSHFIDDSAAVVTIEAGAVLEFDQTAGLRVDDGTIRALGTENDPVTFTAAVQTSGEWRGLVINSNLPDNALDFIVAEYGGATSLGFNGNHSANLIVLSDSRAVVTNSVFRHSSGHGIYSDGEILDQNGDPMTDLEEEGGNEFNGNQDGPYN